MNNSFYGGRDGQPMIIKKKYSTVTEMLEVFKDPSNLEVNFGEYAIIETVNRNNPENGRIFRRGSDYNNKTNNMVDSWILNTDTKIFENQSIEACGAIFISQIVGPSGNAPHLHLLSTKDDVTEQYQDYSNKPGYDVKIGSDDSEASTNELGLGNLVPGKDGNNFNDKITWRYCSVRDENQQETDAYIGFEIPYTVIEWEAHSENPYYNRNDARYDENGILIEGTETDNFINTDLITRHEDDNSQHPFYQKWQIHIPKGIHGQSIKNLRIVDEGTQEKPKQVLKYDYYDYDTIGNPEAEIITVGDYNIIQNINLSDTGYLDIDTTASIGEIHQQLQWVKDITFKEDGTVVLHYIDGTTSENTYENLIDWIKSIHIAQNGKVTVVSNNGTGLLAEDQSKLKWVEGVALEQDGTFKQTYNNGETTPQQTTKLKWATNIQVNNDGTITTEYNNGDQSVQGPTMDWIKSATLNDQKMLNIDYVNAKDISVNLKTPNEIILNSDNNGTTFYATYNTGERVPIGSVGSNTLDTTIASTEEEIDSGLRVGGIAFMIQEN